jgi:hypothetical protein
MKITLSELRTLIRESVQNLLSEGDIDYSLWEAPDVQEFWGSLKNSQKQTIAAVLRPNNQDVVEFLKKEFDLLKKPVGEMTDEEWELVKLKDDPRVIMITDSEDQTLVNIIRDEKALEELKTLTKDWQTGREQKKAKEVASDLASRQTVNESKRTKK